MTDPASQTVPGRRAAHSASALDKATARVVHVVTDEAVHQAFPFGDRKYTDLIARQTRQELDKMIKVRAFHPRHRAVSRGPVAQRFAQDRWETFTKTERFVELCNSLDDIEADAIARAGTRKPANQSVLLPPSAPSD